MTSLLNMALITNAVINGLMIVIVFGYYIIVILKIKLRSNPESKIKTFFVGLACISKFVLAVRSCFQIDRQKIDYWYLFVVYYFIGMMFMLIFLTLVFRVIGSWTIFSIIEM